VNIKESMTFEIVPASLHPLQGFTLPLHWDLVLTEV